MKTRSRAKRVSKEKTRYRVWMAQVNQTWVEVDAHDGDEAADKACRIWRRDCATAKVTCVQEEPFPG